MWSTISPLKQMRKELEVRVYTCMLRSMHITPLLFLLQISEPTAVDWYYFIRDVCTEHFKQHPVQIGGPGLEVEVDESKFGRRNTIGEGGRKAIGCLEEWRG